MAVMCHLAIEPSDFFFFNDHCHIAGFSCKPSGLGGGTEIGLLGSGGGAMLDARHCVWLITHFIP